jgi:adenine-specific DNA-methyltransferase
MSTVYHAKYFAHVLTKRCSADSLEKLAGAVTGTQVDLHPHQVDAALFAFRSPLSKGALLADECGLGKTVEAGLVLSQRWAEHRRRILVITPSTLRNQWHQELTKKFLLPCQILEAKSYNQPVSGSTRPFEPHDAIVICSLQFACAKSEDVAEVDWDLVVIDEAHRLRNVYRPTNVLANTLKRALRGCPKILLTATPLQNSLLELFGLVSLIDERTFGDLRSFRAKYASLDQKGFTKLKERLAPICHRTLRGQVTQFVPFTRRQAILEEFSPDDSEDRLYELVSEYLRRDNLHALPAGQRTLMTLVLRRLLASSTFAIAGALDSVSERLKAKLKKQEPTESLEEDLDNDYEGLGEITEEWPEDNTSDLLSDADRAAIDAEIADLDRFSKLATSITHNAKARALLKALTVAFERLRKLGAAQKAIIFTESRRTQDYLLRVLADSEFKEGIILFNGSNADDRSKLIYAAWLEKYKDTDSVTGSKTADMRSAIVDYFREEGRIMIATEAGAEGINLQFCSLVVNYDLPWNPQRIEQRIGRCHRYGQERDVVVVNFLNRNNEADQHVFRLLSEKFHLFDGVFGASDEVLGAIENGVGLEKRISNIYQNCRSSDEIRVAFKRLQAELSLEINTAMTRTRHQLLENFDESVLARVRNASLSFRNRSERQLMALARLELEGCAEFVSDVAFRLNRSPFSGDVPLGLYELPRRSGKAHLFWANHPLAEAMIQRAKGRVLPPALLNFDYSRREGRISALEPFIGQAGRLALTLFTVDALGDHEEHLILTAMTDSGDALPEEAAEGLFSVPAGVVPDVASSVIDERIEKSIRSRESDILSRNRERDVTVFKAEAKKLDGWADDLKVGLERTMNGIDREVRKARRDVATTSSLGDGLAAQNRLIALKVRRNEKRRSVSKSQSEVDRHRAEFVAQIEGKLVQETSSKLLFLVRWSLRS